MSGVERLKVKAGEMPTAAHVRALDVGIRRSAVLRGARIRRRQFPWGTHHNSSGEFGTGDSPIFQPDVSFHADGTAEVRWNGPRALIGGVAPSIDGKEIFLDDPETGFRPVLVVPPTAYGEETNECRICFKVTTWDDFTAKLVVPVFQKERGAAEPKTAYKLALFLRKRDGAPSYIEEDDRVLFCGQGMLATERRASGTFEALFFATF